MIITFFFPQNQNIAQSPAQALRYTGVPWPCWWATHTPHCTEQTAGLLRAQLNPSTTQPQGELTQQPQLTLADRPPPPGALGAIGKWTEMLFLDIQKVKLFSSGAAKLKQQQKRTFIHGDCWTRWAMAQGHPDRGSDDVNVLQLGKRHPWRCAQLRLSVQKRNSPAAGTSHTAHGRNRSRTQTQEGCLPSNAAFLPKLYSVAISSKGGTPQPPCSLHEQSLSPLASHGLAPASLLQQDRYRCSVCSLGWSAKWLQSLTLKHCLGAICWLHLLEDTND